MKKNIFKEASEKYQDFKARGLIPSDKKDVYREFVKEVASDRKNGSYVGENTARGYSNRLGIEVGYGTGESYTELKNRYLENLLGKYQEAFLDEMENKGGFMELTEKYGAELGFSSVDVLYTTTFRDLLKLVDAARRVEPWVFRQVRGRNRRTESSESENFRSELYSGLGVLKQEIVYIINEYGL